MSELDKKIVASLKKDDEHAMNELFHLYFNKLYYFCVDFVKDKEKAREIVQDAMMNFWQHRSHLNDDSNVYGYLLTIVRNLSLNHLRQYKRHNKFITTETGMVDELALNYQVLADQDWDELLTLEMESVVKQAIDTLPEKCRAVFEFSRFEELSNAEIAQKLQISIKTVEGHITEALKVLRKHLSKYLYIFF